MSLDLTLNSPIPFEDIEKKTKLKIINKEEQNWLVDEDENTIYIGKIYNQNKEEIKNVVYRLTSYGAQNPMKVLDELVKIFGTKFIDDSMDYELIYDPENPIEPDWESLFKRVMEQYGYTFIGDEPQCPDRIKDIYKEPEPLFNASKITDENPDFDELPF